MKRNIILTIAGALLAAAGLVFVILQRNSGASQVPGFLGVGIGCGLFGGNLGALLAGKAARANPAQAKRISIEQQDERNIAVNNRAKAKAYDGMIYIFAALMLAFALAGMPLWATLGLVVAYLLVVALHVFFLSKYQREM